MLMDFIEPSIALQKKHPEDPSKYWRDQYEKWLEWFAEAPETDSQDHRCWLQDLQAVWYKM